MRIDRRMGSGEGKKIDEAVSTLIILLFGRVSLSLHLFKNISGGIV